MVEASTHDSRAKSRIDPGWKYCHALDEGDTNTIVCNYCGKITKGGITRAKQHLMGKKGNVAPCLKCPKDVKEELWEYLANKKNVDTGVDILNIKDFDFAPVGCDESEDGFEDSSTAVNTIKRKNVTKKGQMNMLCEEPKNAINQRNKKLKQTNIRDACDKEARERVHQYIARFWYQAGLPFNLIKLKSFEDMVAAIGQYGPHLPIPSYHDIRVPLLKRELAYTQDLMKRHREQWVKHGCSIMSNAWIDHKQRCHINFFVNSPAGTMFLKSVDGSNYVKTNEKIFELLDAIVEEVGEDNVVQIVTDNSNNYALAGKKLEEKRPHLYWTPCAAQCINLMLEDIGKLPLLRKTMRRANNLVGFIYAHSSTLNLLRNFTNRELVKHEGTRFASCYVTLERLHREKANIRRMFTSNAWTINKLAEEAKEKEAAKAVLKTSFWNNVIYMLKVMGPLVQVLRIVNGERKSSMGYIYEAMDRAKEAIMKSFNNNESKYRDVFAIIDERWNCELHRPLHAAGHFLNPEFFYNNTDLEFDIEVINGLYDCIRRLVPQPDVQQKILTELHLYKIGAGLFSCDFAVKQRKTTSPTYWWRMYGAHAPNLQRLAIKILSLTCSALECERNWSVFDQIHSKKKDTLTQKKLNDLEFVKYNQLLEERYNTRDEINPISLNDIDVCNEWLVGEMNDDDGGAGNELVFDDSSLNWATVRETLGIGEPSGRCKTKKRKKPTSGVTITSAETSKRQPMAGSSKMKQVVVQENYEDVELEDLESEEEVMFHFDECNGEEGDGYAPLDDNKEEENYVEVEEDD